MTRQETIRRTKLQLEAVRENLEKPGANREAWIHMEQWCMKKILILEELIRKERQ